MKFIYLLFFLMCHLVLLWYIYTMTTEIICTHPYFPMKSVLSRSTFHFHNSRICAVVRKYYETIRSLIYLDIFIQIP